MNRKEFLRRVSTGAASFRIDEVSVTFPDHTAHGAGSLELSENGFRIKLRLAEGVPVPEFRGGFLTRKDFGSAQGVIDHDLNLEKMNLPPYQQHSLNNGASTLSYVADAIELSLSSSDTQTYEQIRAMLRGLESAEPQETAPTIVKEKDEASQVAFSGLLRGFKLIAHNGGTRIQEQNDFLGERTSTRSDTQYGELSAEWEYGLIERDEDVEFHLRLKPGAKSEKPAKDLAALHAFFNALSFIHGQHAWPFTLQFLRNHKLITDRIRPPKVPKRSPHRPFNERIWFNAVVGNLEWDFGAALQKAYAFFYGGNKLSAEVSRLLFLCREAAGSNAHTTITNISLCSLLDSAVNFVFEQKVKKRDTEAAAEFDKARSALLSVIGEKILKVGGAGKEAWKRFHTIVTKSESYSAREKFRAVGDCLGLKWEGDWEEIYKFWAKWRPRLVHRGTGSDDEEETIAAEFNVGSRVIGAIHMLVLKLMGYQGIMVSSTFEEQFRRL